MLTEQLKRFSKTLKCCDPLGDNIKGTHEELVDILGADGAAAAISQCPGVLRSPAKTIKGAHEALVGILGADSSCCNSSKPERADVPC